MNEHTFYVVTRRAKFRAKITKNMSIQIAPDGSREPILLGNILTLGGHRAPDCLQINVPIRGNTAHLMWLKSSIGCAIETDNPNAPTEIKGSLTEHMAKLGFTIARHMNPNITTITLEDSASFRCRLPDNKEYAINMTDHDIAFYQKTYYEKRYGATFASDELQTEYTKLIKNFYEPAHKPEYFDFIVPDLNELLHNTYIKTKTWKEFFDSISDKYGSKKCQIIYPWIKSALTYILNKKSFSGQPQSIHIIDIPMVRYKQAEQTAGGRRRETRKNEKYVQPASPPEISKMNWKDFISRLK
jgi:hypothetical protein